MRPGRAWAAAAGALLLALPARAQVIDIAWAADGTFEQNVSVAPGRFAEFCGALNPGQSVEWGFKASRGLNFNIHFHEGQEVRTPARADGRREAQGTLAVDSAHEYCWMWSNKSAAVARLRVHLRKQ